MADGPMTAGALAPRLDATALIEQVVIKGDLSKLSQQERTQYYFKVCESAGLNPLTKPFEYITLNGKLVLYALRACTDQLRTVHGVSVEDMTESDREGVFIVTCKVRNRDGRTDIAKGAVSITNLKGEALANAMMKAETKAKRRATLSLCGLGLLDETEVETIPGGVVGEPVDVTPKQPPRVATPKLPAAQAETAPPPTGAVSAEPKSREDEARERFRFHQAQIKAARSNDALDAVMAACGWPPGSVAPAHDSDLALIYQISPEAGQKMVALMVKRRKDIEAEVKKALGDDENPF